MITQVDIDQINTGDLVEVDGSSGYVRVSKKEKS
jgi:hypothetical protein